jgi:hypothetical protein
MTWDRQLYFHSEEVVLQIFITLKSPSSSARFEPMNVGSNGKHATIRTTSKLNNAKCSIINLCYYIQFGSATHPASYPMGTGDSLHGGRWLEREADHSTVPEECVELYFSSSSLARQPYVGPGLPKSFTFAPQYSCKSPNIMKI